MVARAREEIAAVPRRVQRDWSDAPPGPMGGATSGQAPAPKIGWNRGEVTVGAMRRIPVEGLTQGNQDADPQAAAAEAANGRAIVVIPAGLDVTQPVEVLLHLHGHNIGYRQRTTAGTHPTSQPGTVRDVETDRIEQQIEASKRPLIGILAQGTAKSGFGKLNSDAYIKDVFRVLGTMGVWGQGAAPPAVRSVILSGHSGAGGAIAEMLDEAGQPRLSSALGEMALFDAINGPRELASVQSWVVRSLDRDLAALLAAGTASGVVAEAQTQYLATSLRFRAYYTNTTYRDRHLALQKTIDGWFQRNAAALGGSGSPLYVELQDHYKTIPVGHADHDAILGKGNQLAGALGDLPKAAPPAPAAGAQGPVQRRAAAGAGPVLARGPAIHRWPGPWLRRQVLDLGNGHKLGAVPTPGANDNLRGEAELALHRLLDLWAITNQAHDDAIAKWLALAQDAQITGADLAPLTNAIQQNEKPTLANEVANHYLGLSLPGKRGIGDGQTNDPNDVKAVQRVFTALRIATGSLNSDITAFKRQVASATLGLRWNPQRQEELEHGADKFAGQTFEKALSWEFQPDKGSPIKVDYTASVFVPRQALATAGNPEAKQENYVHVFFSPNDVRISALNDVSFQGLRAQSDSTKWILIGVPSRCDKCVPNWNQISMAQIGEMLQAAGRTQTSVAALRLSAHSRGHRGLEHTLTDKDKGQPLLDRSLIEKIAVFDASYQDLGKALNAAKASLPRLLNASGEFDPEKVVLYDVTIPNISGVAGRSVPLGNGFRAIGYVRLILDAMAHGTLQPPPNILALVHLLTEPSGGKPKLPPLGGFSSKSNPPSGQLSIFKFVSDHAADITQILDSTKGLPPYIEDKKLGYVAAQWHAHEYFVAELAHEVVDTP